MNFKSLKVMVDSLIKSHNCPECNSVIVDKNIDIIGAAGTSINLDIECGKCGKHSMVKTEVLTLNITEKGVTPENLSNIKKVLFSNNSQIITSQKAIKDEEIIDLNKDLKKEELNVSDLLGDM